MKALFISEDRRLALREVPTPGIGPGEVLVRMRACGICGTDLEKLRGWSLTPLQLGHEVSGEVELVGEGVSGIRPGDRVIVHHHVSCGTCYFCLNGAPTLCELFAKTNLDPCGFAERFRVPRANVERGGVIGLPPELSFEEGTFVEPLACCIRALRRFEFRSPMSVALFGTGPMGLLFIKLLRALGAGYIAAFDIREERLAFARLSGADIAANPLREDPVTLCGQITEHRGVDLAIVATSSSEALLAALRVLRKGGMLGLFGAPEPGEVRLVPQQLFIRELTLRASYSTTEAEIHAALDLLRARRIRVDDMVTHLFPLEDAVKAFEAAQRGDAVKVLVVA
jgi:L-iditol 2-dehydrogenase